MCKKWKPFTEVFIVTQTLQVEGILSRSSVRYTKGCEQTRTLIDALIIGTLRAAVHQIELPVSRFLYIFFYQEDLFLAILEKNKQLQVPAETQCSSS